MTTTIKLFTNAVSERNRFYDSSAVSAFYDNATFGLEIRLPDVVLSPNMAYFDIDLTNTSKLLNELWEYSSFTATTPFVGTQSSKINKFIGIITRIEQNTFGQSLFRIYFHTDWWDTLLWNNINVSDKIDGAVNRAHVKDVKLGTNNHDEIWCENFYYTEQQEVVPNYITESKIPYTNYIDYNGKYYHKKFLYLMVKTEERDNCFVTSFDQLEDFAIIGNVPIPFSLVCFPLDEYGFLDFYRQDGGLVDRLHVSALSVSDSRVIGMFISSIKPDVFSIGNDQFYVIPSGTSDFPTKLIDITFESDTGNPKTSKGVILNSLPTAKINSLNQRTYTKNKSIMTVSRYNNLDYNNFKNFGITKAHNAPYIIDDLIIGGMFVNAFSMDYSNAYDFEDRAVYARVGISPLIGGYYVNTYKWGKANLSNVTFIEIGGITSTFQTNDYYTQLNNNTRAIIAKNNSASQIVRTATNFVSGTLKSAGGLVGVSNPSEGLNAVGNVVNVAGNLVGDISSSINAVTETKNIKAQTSLANIIGENTSIQGGIEQTINGYSDILYYTLSPQDMETIYHDLYLYGYYTMLHPHDLFNPIHKRKYFNFMQIEECVIYDNSLNEMIKQDIANMFMHGVWLHSYNADNTFSFEMPNICEL